MIPMDFFYQKAKTQLYLIAASSAAYIFFLLVSSNS